MLVRTDVAVVGAKTKNATAAPAAASMTMTPQSRRAQAATTLVTMKIVNERADDGQHDGGDAVQVRHRHLVGVGEELSVHVRGPFRGQLLGGLVDVPRAVAYQRLSLVVVVTLYC